MDGSSYILLPSDIKNKKAVIAIIYMDIVTLKYSSGI